MPVDGEVTIVEPDGSTDGPHRATVEVGDDAVSILPEGGAPVHLPLVDIDDLFDDDYALRLTDHTGRRYDLSMLGRAYGQIAADVRSRRDAELGRDLLLTGVALQDTFPAKVLDPAGLAAPVSAEVRLFQDLMVVVPERGTMWGLPYSFVEKVDWDPNLYQVHVRADDGTVHAFGQLGRRTEEFHDELRRLLDALARRTAGTLSRLLPGVDPAVVSRLAGEMRDGRAVQHRVVDAIDPSLWPRLEDAVVGTAELRASYEGLKARSPAGWAALGVKAVLGVEERPARPASGEEAGSEAAEGERTPTGAGRATEVLWYLCPLARDGRPVNAVAQEVTSEEGKATYVFRLQPPARWREAEQAGGEALVEAAAAGMARLNRALLTLNFRREPILASDEDIATPRFARYRVAVRKLPYLRETREAFLGRAIHDDTWERQLDAAASRA